MCDQNLLEHTQNFDESQPKSQVLKRWTGLLKEFQQRQKRHDSEKINIEMSVKKIYPGIMTGIR